MMDKEVLNRALTLTGPLSAELQAQLELLCEAAVSVLEKQLREGLTPEDCREPFIAAACLQVLATMGDDGVVSEFKAGDLTVKKTRQGTRSLELQEQAQVLMRPYVKDRFLFTGV